MAKSLNKVKVKKVLPKRKTSVKKSQKKLSLKPKISVKKSQKKSLKKVKKVPRRKTSIKKSQKKSLKKSNKKLSLKKLDACYFKGVEPSPKGFGLCAHEQKEGEKAEGTDGNLWVVKRRSNGSLYWKKMSRDNGLLSDISGVIKGAAKVIKNVKDDPNVKELAKGVKKYGSKAKEYLKSEEGKKLISGLKKGASSLKETIKEGLDVAKSAIEVKRQELEEKRKQAEMVDFSGSESE